MEKNHPQNQRIRQVAINILNYLRDHTQAKDTVDGIARWWVHEETEVVKDALDLLQKEGVIKKNGQLYQLKQRASGQDHRTSLETMLRRLSQKE